MQKEINQTCHFTQSPKEVWEYLTRPELMEQWLAKSDFKPVAGHKFRFTNGCESDNGRPPYTFCEVLEIIPYRLLSFSWQKGENEKAITLDPVVTWTLTDKNGETELRLQHNGFTLSEDVAAHTNGWNNCVRLITELMFSPNRVPTVN